MNAATCAGVPSRLACVDIRPPPPVCEISGSTFAPVIGPGEGLSGAGGGRLDDAEPQPAVVARAAVANRVPRVRLMGVGRARAEQRFRHTSRKGWPLPRTVRPSSTMKPRLASSSWSTPISAPGRYDDLLVEDRVADDRAGPDPDAVHEHRALDHGALLDPDGRRQHGTTYLPAGDHDAGREQRLLGDRGAAVRALDELGRRLRAVVGEDRPRRSCRG